MKDLSKGLIVFYQTSLLRLILSAYTFYDTVNMQGAYIHVPCYLRFQIKYEVETQTSETPQQGLVTNDVPNVASWNIFFQIRIISFQFSENGRILTLRHKRRYNFASLQWLKNHFTEEKLMLTFMKIDTPTGLLLAK